MGHIFVEGISYQVTHALTTPSDVVVHGHVVTNVCFARQIADTPGLIFRPEEQRNSIEKLAIAMIEKTQAVRLAWLCCGLTVASC